MNKSTSFKRNGHGNYSIKPFSDFQNKNQHNFCCVFQTFLTVTESRISSSSLTQYTHTYKTETSFTKEYLPLLLDVLIFPIFHFSFFFVLFSNADCKPLKIFLQVARREIYSLENNSPLNMYWQWLGYFWCPTSYPLGLCNNSSPLLHDLAAYV